MKQKSAIEQAALLDIIGLIYDTPNDAKLWHELLENIDALVQVQEHKHKTSSDDYIEILTPHIHRAISMTDKDESKHQEYSALSNIIDQLPIGVILVDALNAPITLNSRAEAFLQKSPFLRIDKGKLVATSSKETGHLYKLIQLANQGDAQDFLMSSKDNKTCALHIMQASRTNIEHASDLTAIFITCTDTQRHFSTSELMQMLHITEAEARLVSTLLDSSHNLSEAADTLQISKHTVRNQMKSILEKTNTGSQSELLKKVLRSRDAIIESSETSETDDKTLESNNTKYTSLTLHDSSSLEYTEYGDPSGIPIMYFHGIIHSRQIFNPFSDYIETHGLRIIAPERPGFGATSLPKDISLTSFANNIKQLADHLGIEKFYVLGEGNGGGAALACADTLPKQVIRTSVVACVPDRSFDQLRKLFPFERQLHQMKQKYSKTLAIPLAKIMLKMLSKYDVFIQLMASNFHHTDRDIVLSPEYARIFQGSMRNALPYNAKGFLQDYFSRSQDWDFQTQNISGHVDVWHGDSDPYTKIESAKAIADSIPTHTTHFLENHGHYIFFSHTDKILEQLIRH